MTDLIIILGHPASGKTTLARHLCAELALPCLCKDDIKEALFDTLGMGGRARSRRYSDASFAALLRLARTQLDAGSSCLIEGNWRAEYAAAVLAMTRNADTVPANGEGCHGVAGTSVGADSAGVSSTVRTLQVWCHAPPFECAPFRGANATSGSSGCGRPARGDRRMGCAAARVFGPPWAALDSRQRRPGLRGAAFARSEKLAPVTCRRARRPWRRDSYAPRPEFVAASGCMYSTSDTVHDQS